MLEHITASEVAGYGVGALLLCATISAPKIDSFISASQRSSLGMCKRYSNLKLIACSNCKGSGSLNQCVAFSLGPIDGVNSKMSSLSCNKCRSRGHFPCPECSKEIINIRSNFRLWRQPMYNNPVESYSIEFIFVEKQTSILKRCFFKFKKLLMESGYKFVYEKDFRY